MTVNKEILNEAKPIIEKLAKMRSSGGAFAYYESCDIYQEVWFLCLEALNRYDPSIGPIENYLVSHITNRMKNLKRDKYFRPGSDVPSSGHARVRMNLVNALPLGCDDMVDSCVLLCSEPINIEPIEYLLRDETLIYIRSRMPEELLEPFEELLGRNNVRSPLVAEVRSKVAEILAERDNDVGS
jgi:hypothetical protein